MLHDLRGKVLVSLAMGALVMLGLTLYADAPRMVGELRRFRWELIPIVLALTLANYLIRFLKFRYFLHRIGVSGLPLRMSLLIFFAGLSMVVTPGKVGEWLKSYLLKEAHRVPLSRSTPIVLAERLSDAVAMAILAIGGLLIVRSGWEMVAASIVLVGGIMTVFAFPPVSHLALAIAGRIPLVSGKVRVIREFFESGASVLGLRSFATAVGIALIAWAGESLGYGLVLIGFGVEPSVAMLLEAAFMFATSILAGALFLVPGGLVVAEGGMTGLAQILLGLTASQAAAATLLTRLCTIWFGVAIGSVALIFVTKDLGEAHLQPNGRAVFDSPAATSEG